MWFPSGLPVHGCGLRECCWHRRDLDAIARVIIKADNRFGNRFGIWIVEALARGKQPVTVIQVRQLGVNVICLAEARSMELGVPHTPT